jgi:hypothetical protein
MESEVTTEQRHEFENRDKTRRRQNTKKRELWEMIECLNGEHKLRVEFKWRIKTEAR